MRGLVVAMVLAATGALPGMAMAQQDGPGQRDMRASREAPRETPWRGRDHAGGQSSADRPRPGGAPLAGDRGGSGRWQGGGDGMRRFDESRRPDDGARPAPRRPPARLDRRGDGAGDRRPGGDRGGAPSAWRGDTWTVGDGGRFDGQRRRFADRRDDWRDTGRFMDRARWNRGWQDDGRYDHNIYRADGRRGLRLPRYDAPRGWGYGYHRFAAGIRLSPLLFARHYWIVDFDDYRLPAAAGPYRWVRYYDDALLVDLRSGVVVDTVYDLFR